MEINSSILCHESNYTKGRVGGEINYIVIHYTANDGDTDENNGKYFYNNVVKASAHYFVDSDSVTQSVPDNYVAYSVGGNKYSNCSTTGGGSFYGKCTNTNSISIELCDDYKNGTIKATQATINNAIELTKILMKKYNIPLSNVIRHFDVNGKSCPAYWCGNATKNALWLSEFKNKLTSTTKTTLYRVRKTWTDASSQLGAYSSLANAKAACKTGYFVFDENGNIVYPITTSTSTVPLKVTQNNKSIQTFLNTYYGTEIKKVLGALLVVDGKIGDKSKLALGIAFQVELNKLGAGLTVDGKFGTKSATAFNTYVGVLKSGMKNNIFVTLWQCVLVAHNTNPNGIDGDFGAGCATATNGLFAKIGLTKDSSVSGADINALL